MSITSILQHDTTASPLRGLATPWKRSKLWLDARRERWAQRLAAERLLQLRQHDPFLYADLRVDLDPIPPSRSAVSLLPHVVIAGFYLEERR